MPLFQNKATKQDKLLKLQKRQQELEQGEHAQQIAWFEKVFYKLPEHERQELKTAWDNYFKLCSQSPEADLYRATARALKESNLPRVKELQKQARQMLKNGIVQIVKPKGHDPQLWGSAIWSLEYRHIKNEIKRIELEGDDFAGFTQNSGGVW